MKKWWNWVLGFSLCCLAFLAIPLTLSRQKSIQELKPMFDEYIQKFNKSYRNPEEYDTRFQHFVASVREIEKLNAGSRGPDHCKAKYGLTRLSDMSKTEFKEIHLSDERQHKSPNQYGKSWSKGREVNDALRYDVDEDHRHSDHERHRNPGNEPHNNIYIIIRKKRALLPMQVDWRTKGVIGPVRNQGLCGACWAFSTIGTMEAMSAIKTGKLETLSVQEVIDCAGLGNSGCAGGDICLLLDWLLITNTPVEKETEYPLRLTDGLCKAKKNTTGVMVQSFTCDDFVGAEDKILQALATHGPVTVAVNALTWQNYLGGIIQFHCSGAPADLNHAVEIVGYDLTADVPHYIAKNSWGKDFGNGGYINLAIGSNICGLANEVATVDVK
ncbi:cathepsin O-like [Anticarsia gemmatalis]|uniref:cathepsin O-like n=1 Tax=Anticarsia gemmatalis TaxID=129554 RepID=UPI003F7731EA